MRNITTFILALAIVFALVGCAKPAPLSGQYKAHAGALEFNTTTEGTLFLMGSSRWSGTFYEASYERDGSDLVFNTKSRGGQTYKNKYFFKVLKDGAVLHLVKMESLDLKNNQTEKIDTPVEEDFMFSKILAP